MTLPSPDDILRGLPFVSPEALRQPQTPQPTPTPVEPPEEVSVGLPEAATPSPSGEPSPVEPYQAPPTGLVLDTTVRVPLLEEAGLIEPYRGKDDRVVLDIGPSTRKLAGMVTGAIEKSAPFVSVFLDAMVDPFMDRQETPERKAKRLRQAREVAVKFDRAFADKKQRAAEVEEAEGFIDTSFAFLDNTQEDIKDVLLGLATLFNESVGIQARVSGRKRSEVGKEFGGQMAEGLALITGSVFEGAEQPGDFGGAISGMAKSFKSRPLTTFLTIYPLVKIAQKSAIPGSPGGRAAAAAEQAARTLWEKSGLDVPFSNISKAVGESAPVKRAAEFRRQVIRAAEDPTQMATPEATRVAEMAIDEPRIAAQKTQALTERFAREVAPFRRLPDVEAKGMETLVVPPEAGVSPKAVRVRGTDPLMTEGRQPGFVPQKRLLDVLAEQEKRGLINPREMTRIYELVDRVDELSGQEIRIGPQRGATTLDTGFGGAFDAVLNPKGFSQAVAKDIASQAVALLGRVRQRGLKSPVAVTKAAILELIENYDVRVAENLTNIELNALLKSTQRQALRLELQDILADYTSGTVRAPRVRTEVFEVTPEGVVRQPMARNRLGYEAISLLEDNNTFVEMVESLKDRRVELKDRNVARKELLERTERAFQEGKRLDVRVTENIYPQFGELVNYVYKQFERVLPKGTDIEAGPFSRRVIAGRFIEALNSETTSLLRDPKVAAVVRNQLLKKAKEAGVPRPARRKLVTEFNDFIGETAASQAETIFPEFSYNGKKFFGKKEFIETYQKLSNKQKIKAAQFATTRIGYEIAAELELAKQTSALVNEVNRFKSDATAGSPDTYAFSMATEVLVNNKARPLIMPHNGKQIGASLRAGAETFSQVIEAKTGLPRAQALKQINDLANYVETFTPMDRTVRPLTKQKVAGLAYPRELTSAYAEPAFNSSVFWDIASKTGAIQSGAANWLVSIGNLFKRNVVARGTPALVNNNISNTLAVSARRGKTPPSVMGDIVAFNDLLRKYLRGEKETGPTPEGYKFQIVEALEKEGLFGSNEVRQDFTRAAKTPSIIRGRLREELALAEATPLGKAGQVMSDLQNFFEYTYTRFGDDLFKGETAFHRGVKAFDQMAEQQIGSYSILRNNNKTYWKVTRIADDLYEADLYNNAGKSLNKRVRSKLRDTKNNSQLLKLVARDGLLAGNELFFDYGQVGNWTKVLRALPITNLTSSFHTWYFKALDIPFVKKGLVYRTLVQGDYIPTNDPVLLRMNLSEAAQQAMRKSIIANSMVGVAQQRDDQKQVSVPLSFSPSRQELGLILAASDPDYVLQYALGSRDYTDPTVIGIKAIQKGLLTLREAAEYFGMDPKQKKLFPDRADLEKMSDKEWKKLQRQRALFLRQMDGTVLSPKEALELVGIGGSIALNFYEYIREAEKQGRVLDFPSLVRNFSRVLLGSNVARFADVTAAAVSEGSPFTRLGKQEMRRGFRGGQTSPNQSDFTQYVIKTLFGLGWNSIQYFSKKDELKGSNTLSAVQRYISGLKGEMKANLVKPLEDKARRFLVVAKNAKTDEAAKAAQDQADAAEIEAERINDAIDLQAEILQDRFEGAYDKLWGKTYGPIYAKDGIKVK